MLYQLSYAHHVYRIVGHERVTGNLALVKYAYGPKASPFSRERLRSVIGKELDALALEFQGGGYVNGIEGGLVAAIRYGNRPLADFLIEFDNGEGSGIRLKKASRQGKFLSAEF